MCGNQVEIAYAERILSCRLIGYLCHVTPRSNFSIKMKFAVLFICSMLTTAVNATVPRIYYDSSVAPSEATKYVDNLGYFFQPPADRSLKIINDISSSSNDDVYKSTRNVDAVTSAVLVSEPIMPGYDELFPATIGGKTETTLSRSWEAYKVHKLFTELRHDKSPTSEDIQDDTQSDDSESEESDDTLTASKRLMNRILNDLRMKRMRKSIPINSYHDAVVHARRNYYTTCLSLMKSYNACSQEAMDVERAADDRNNATYALGKFDSYGYHSEDAKMVSFKKFMQRRIERSTSVAGLAGPTFIYAPAYSKIYKVIKKNFDGVEAVTFKHNSIFITGDRHAKTLHSILSSLEK